MMNCKLLGCNCMLFAMCAGSTSAAELSNFLSNLQLPIADLQIPFGNKETSNVHVKNAVVHDIKWPSLDVSHPSAGMVRMKATVGATLSTAQVDIHREDQSWKEWFGVGKNIHFTDVTLAVAGDFSTSVSVVFETRVVRFSDCKANVTATLNARQIKTDGVNGWLNGPANSRVQSEVRDQISNVFKQKICGADALTEHTQKLIDNLLSTTESSDEKTEMEKDDNSLSAVDWSETKAHQWLKRFSEHATDNGFGWDGTLHPLLENAVGECLMGNRKGLSCLAPVPEAVGRLLTHEYRASTEGGNGSLRLRIDGLALLLKNYSVQHAQFPKVNQEHQQWLGVSANVGPVHLKLVADLVIESQNFGPDASVRKSLSLDFGVERFDVESFFRYEVSDFQYQALTKMQRVTPACLDALKPKFQFEVLNLDLRLQQIVLTLSSIDAKEDFLVKSLVKLLNLLIVSGINNNAADINNLVQTVVRPGLEAVMNLLEKGGGMTGLLNRVGINFWGDKCVKPSTAADTIKHVIYCLFALMFFAGLAVKTLAAPPTVDGRCLITKRSTEHHWRIIVPLLMLTACLMLIISNTMPAATMRVYLLFDDADAIPIKDLDQFSVVESMIKLWQGGAKLLAFLIACFSLVFPYVKLLVCLCLLFIPMTDRTRGIIAHMIDGIGKLSLLDAFGFIVVSILGSFQVHFTGGIGAAIFIEFEVGFQAFLGGTITCMLVGHLIVLLHHRAATPTYAEEAEKAASLMDTLPLTIQLDRSTLDNTTQHQKCNAVLFATVFFTIGLGLSVGSFMTFSVLEVEGLFGWFLNYVHETNLRVRSNSGDQQVDMGTGNVFTLSVMTLGYLLGAETPSHTRLWAVQLQAIYFAFTVVFVLFYLIVGIGQCLWIFVKHNVNAHKEQLVLLKFVGSTLFAWAAIDVYVIGAMITISEMESGNFSYTSPFFAKLIHGLRSSLEIPGNGDVIMALHPKLHAGAYLMLLSSLALVGTGIHFTCFLGRLQVAAPLEESDGTQQEAQQEVCLQILSQSEGAPLLSAAGGRSLDSERQ